MNTKTALIAAAALALATTVTATATHTQPRHQFQRPAHKPSRDQIKERINSAIPSEVKHKLAQHILHDIKKTRHQRKTGITTIATLDEDDEQGINPVSDILVPVIVGVTGDLIKGWQKDWEKSHKKSKAHDEDEEQNALVDIGIGVAVNVISDGIKNWQEHDRKTGSLFEEDEFGLVDVDDLLEEQGFTEVIYQVVKGVLVPVATRWVEDRMSDVGRWIKTLDDDEEVQAYQLSQYVNQISREATSFVIAKTQREAMMQLYDDEDQEQVLPILIWVGGVLVEVLEGVVINIIVDKSVALGKKIIRGQKLWDEEEEQSLPPWVTPTFPTTRGFDEEEQSLPPWITPTLPTMRAFDEEQGQRPVIDIWPIMPNMPIHAYAEDESKTTRVGRKSAPLPNPEGEKQQILHKWRRAIKSGDVKTDDEVKDAIRRHHQKRTPNNKYKHFTPKTFDEDEANWEFNAGLSGQFGGKPSYNVGITGRWDEEEEQKFKLGKALKKAAKVAVKANELGLLEEADWGFNAGISGQVGQKPNYNVGISAKWDEEEQWGTMEKPAPRPGRFYRANKATFY